VVAGFVDHAGIFAHFLFNLGDPVAISSRKLCVGSAPIPVLDDFKLACDSA
jgi:hypothetical protein